MLDEDLLLWDRFRNGDADAFAAPIRVHYQDLFNYGIRIARDEELVKDGIQDLLLSLWKNRATINGTSFVKYYLLKSLRRRLIKAIGNNRHLSIYDQSYFEGAVWVAASRSILGLAIPMSSIGWAVFLRRQTQKSRRSWLPIRRP